MAGKMKLYGKDLSEYDDIDVDALLEKLTPEELEELGQELIDPDDTHIPPSARCRYKCDKAPTGPYNRKALVDFLEKKAKEEKDWPEEKPFSKEIRGKVWKPKEQEKIVIDEDDVETEWDDVLANATEEELVDLAAILGFHGMLNQVQYHRAFVSGNDDDEEDENGGVSVGFQGVAKHEPLKHVKDEPPNDTDVEATLQKIKDNDPKLKEVNLNNIKNITLDRLKDYGKALSTNTNLESLNMANVRATDKVCKAVADSLKENKTLKQLNLESNYISGEAILYLLEALNENTTLTELRLANQRPATLGVRTEMKISELVKENTTLLKLGLFLDTRDARLKIQEAIKRNNDKVRQQRVGASGNSKKSDD